MAELTIPTVETVEKAIAESMNRIKALKALRGVAEKVARLPEGVRGDALKDVQEVMDITVEIEVEKCRLSHLRQLLTAAKKFEVEP